jgi:hypothetical protein
MPRHERDDFEELPGRRQTSNAPLIILAVVGVVLLLVVVACGGLFFLGWRTADQAVQEVEKVEAEAEAAREMVRAGKAGGDAVAGPVVKEKEPDQKAPALPQTANTTHQGLSVDQYGPLLLDTDKKTSITAAAALEKMGAESLRWFYRGLTSGVPHVVDYSVSYMPGTSARPYAKVFEPLLIPMLTDESPTRRSQSCVKLVDMRSEAGIKRIRELINDKRTPARDREHFSGYLKNSGL